MYQQDLYSVITPVKGNILSKRNSLKNWKYGYDKDSDIIVISKTGQIGDIYNIQGLKIALPKQPKKIVKGNNLWKPEEYPKELKRIQSIFEWKDYSDSFKEKWEDYSIYSGKRARQMHVLTVFATLKIGVPDFHLWHQEKRLIKLRYRVTPGLVYYRNQVLMRRRCSQTKLCLYRSTIRFSLNRSRMVWIDQNRN